MGIPLRIGAQFSPGPVIYGELAQGRSLGVRDLATQLGLPAALLPDVLVAQLELFADPSTGHIELDAALAVPWSFRFSDKTLALTDVTLHLARAGGWELEIGAFWQLGEVPLSAQAGILPDSTGLTLWLGLMPDTSVHASALLAALLPVALPANLPDLELRDAYAGIDTGAGTFKLGAESPTLWTLPVGDLALRDIAVELAHAPGGGLSGAVAGTLGFAGTSFQVDYAFPGNFVLAGEIESLVLSPLLQSLCGAAALVGLPMPAGVLTLELREIHFRLAVDPRLFAISGVIPGFGQAELAALGTKLALAIALDSAWRPSQLHAALAPLDGLRLSNT
jgi:hypothetical protein